MKNTALILVDLQIDYFPGGAMEVQESNPLISLANQLMGQFELVIGTKDWHPANHCSFAANHPWRKLNQEIELKGIKQHLWPIHCVQDTFGAHFHPALNISEIDEIISKGTNPQIDSYSCFFDNAKQNSTQLDTLLKNRAIKNLLLLGLPLELGIKHTALDALELGYTTWLVEGGWRSLNKEKEVGIIDNLKSKGVQILKIASTK